MKFFENHQQAVAYYRKAINYVEQEIVEKVKRRDKLKELLEHNQRMLEKAQEG